MDLKSYLKELNQPDRIDFAERCGTTPAALRNVAYGQRKASAGMCINIERESKGAIRCESLRPDVDWAYIRSSRDG